jgi:hypothetical protein
MEAIQTTKLKHVDHRYVYLPLPKIKNVSKNDPKGHHLSTNISQHQHIHTSIKNLNHSAPTSGPDILTKRHTSLDMTAAISLLFFVSFNSDG